MRLPMMAPRRGLRKADAAAYLGVSASKFDEMVRERRLPSGFAIDGCRVWDIHDLDIAFDILKGASVQSPMKAQAEAFDRL